MPDHHAKPQHLVDLTSSEELQEPGEHVKAS